jgi:NDP-sugar pyrophosphorylase family protein
MKVLIPMAGRGGRLSEYEKPKPLIDICGKPMIQRAVESLGIDGEYIFIIREYDNKYFNKELRNLLTSLVDSSTIISVDHITDGTACTALLAKNYINNEDSLIVANCDQIMYWESSDFLNACAGVDGAVVTYPCTSIKNSYAMVDPNNDQIIRVAEKEVIGKDSLNGIHYWKHGSDFVRSAEQMIKKDIKVNGEFYIAPTYNELINEGLFITPFRIKRKQHFAIGDPEDLETYVRNYKTRN